MFIDKWEESYERKENFIYYPKEEVVRFLNRYVVKRNGVSSFEQILNPGKKLRGLDFGCGIGRQAILLEEFGIEGYGVDISSKALKEATRLSESMGFSMEDRLLQIREAKLPFDDNYFDVGISDSTLDSMEFDIAKTYVKELDRTVTSLLYISVISGKNIAPEFNDDVIVDTKHEEGTVQSYYDEKKIEELILETSFEIIDLREATTINMIDKNRSGRYHIVLKKA